MLSWLFNGIFSSGIYPQSWGASYIQPIHKKGGKSQPENYRPISISSCMSKLFGNVLNNRLEEFMKEHGITHDFQGGFKKKHRTVDNIFVIKTIIDKYMYVQKEGVYAGVVDVKSAYDKVSRNGLLLKMLRNGVGSKFYNIVKDMYSKVKTCVKVGDRFTVDFATNIGLKQGDVLSPLLFNLYIHDIIKIFDNSSEAPFLGDMVVHCLMYADDLVLLSQSEKGLQNSLNALYGYCRKWKLCINTEKTKVVHFHKGKRKQDKYVWKWGADELKLVDDYTYLGVTLKNDCKFQMAREVIKNKASKAMFALLKYCKGADLPVKLALDLFRKLVSPILIYGCEIWTAPDTNRCLQNKTLIQAFADNSSYQLPGENVCLQFARFALGVHRKTSNIAIRGELGLYPIYIDCVVNMCKYWQRVAMYEPNTLLGRAYSEQANMMKNNKYCWLLQVEKILKCLNMDGNILHPELFDCNKLKEQLINGYNVYWKDILMNDNRKQGGNKLRTYREFKYDFKYECYLSNVKIKKHRVDLTRFRISSHRLHIETGRYKRPPTPLDERICFKCNNNCVEDEYHIFKCEFYENLRLEHNIDVCNKDDFCMLMKDDDKSVTLSSYVSKCLNVRECQ